MKNNSPIDGLSYPPFPGFRPEGLAFLRQLKANNHREWFKAHKELYEEELLWPMRCLLAELNTRLRMLSSPLTADPQRGIFRIYRDIRFSKDKSPYKTHIGAILSRTGNRKDQGVLYIHIEPAHCFLGAGFWKPDAATLRALRKGMVQEAFSECIEHLTQHQLFVQRINPLKRMPRGFETYAHTPLASFLKARSLIIEHPLPEEAIFSRAFLQHILTFSSTVLPFLNWGWSCID